MTPPQICKCDIIHCVPCSDAGFPELQQVEVGDVPGSVSGIFCGRPRGCGVGVATGMSKSRWAGFNLSIEMVSSFPPLSIVKTFGEEVITLNWPS